jgi:glycosyltransferase involved in cell wall biosynthesis
MKVSVKTSGNPFIPSRRLMSIFCSTIIPTIGRKSLTDAVLSVLNQNTQAEFEIIVVNDSGQPLEKVDWMSSNRVKILTHQRRERCFARNAGVAAARGQFLHFLDDDDILLPGAIEALWELSTKSSSGWLYGFYHTVDNAGNIVQEIRPQEAGNCFALFVAGESIPFQVSMLNTECFFKAGGFDTDPRILGVEDRELGRRLAMLTTLSYTPNFVAQIRIGQSGSTTNWNTIAESDRLGREKALLAENSFSLIRKTTANGYLDGRVCRAYLASGVWNLKKRKILPALNRFITSLFFLLRSGISRGFWEGLVRIGKVS